jgi:hypothetical protein
VTTGCCVQELKSKNRGKSRSGSNISTLRKYFLNNVLKQWRKWKFIVNADKTVRTCILGTFKSINFEA